MSSQGWTVDGFGFGLAYGKENGHNALSFIANHEDVIRMLGGESFIDLAKTCGSLHDFIETAEYDGWEMYSGKGGGEGFGALVADVMTEETDVRFCFCAGDGNTGSSDTVMLAECMPWLFSEKEKALTQESLSEIMKPYMQQLGIEDSPDYVSVEYYG